MSDVDLISEFKASRLMRSVQEVQTFERLLAAIAGDPRRANLRDLHLAFDDNCLHKEVMFGLIHFLESFDVDEQLQAFIEVLPVLHAQAPEWTRIMHYRILNDDTARLSYKRILQSIEAPARDTARDLLLEIATQEQPKLAGLARSVLE